jgi:hypothetical protein
MYLVTLLFDEEHLPEVPRDQHVFVDNTHHFGYIYGSRPFDVQGATMCVMLVIAAKHTQR